MKIDAAWVDLWADKYESRYETNKPESLERRLLSDVSESIRRRGHYRLDELIEVGKWKSKRAVPRLQTNSDADVVDITGYALGGRLELQVRLLSLLHGVRRPMAAALLTIADPERFTMIDFRTVRTYPALGLLPPNWDGDYADYLCRLRKVAHELGVPLRRLDRAAFMWDKEGEPGR